MKKRILISLTILFIMSGCKIVKILQPKSADNNSLIELELVVSTEIVPETNAHKGLVAILLPEDWAITNASYESDLGSGTMELSESWKDSVNKYYPNEISGMKWEVLISDKGYSYSAPFETSVKIEARTGSTEGCFSLGYLVTKATGGMLNSGNPNWAPFSYPHKISVPEKCECVEEYSVRKAEEWDNLLNRNSGWTGSDGIYSIPVNSLEKPNNQDHLLLFSDTFIGKVDSTGKRINTTMVNNTLAYQRSGEPSDTLIDFLWKTENNVPKSVFIPDTPDSKAGEWFWLMDGIKIDEIYYAFALRVEHHNDGLFNFRLNGAVLISFELGEDHYPTNITQVDFPFFAKEGNNVAVLGQAIMPMTNESGAEDSDGYIYIYGPKDFGGNKNLLCGRVLPQNISKFDKWEFWNGENWCFDFSDCASITDQISQEFSITQRKPNEYLLVFQYGASVAVRKGKSPTGPFGFYEIIYTAPEVDQYETAFVYNAKAHPSLSNNDELLVSYNVNTLSLSDNINIADIYRPRFVWVKINEQNSSRVETGISDLTFYLSQNYPNPFNPETHFDFEITEDSDVTLEIINSLGERVSTLLNCRRMSRGNYSFSWRADNFASGIYFYRLRVNNNEITKKMLLLR